MTRDRRKARAIKTDSLRTFVENERHRPIATEILNTRLPQKLKEALYVAAVGEDVPPAVLTRWAIYHGLKQLGIEAYSIPSKLDGGDE